MSRRSLPPVAEVETDEALGSRIMAQLVCACGSREIFAVAPGHEGFRVNLLGESAEGPGRTFALTSDRPAQGQCLRCCTWPRGAGARALIAGVAA